MSKKLHLYDNDLFYRKVGSGPCVLFLHGFLGDGSIWNRVISDLVNGFTCINIDLPGHGKSGMDNVNYSFDSLALSIVSILEVEEVKVFHIVGHSMGGYLGLSLAKLIPDRIKGIILLNSTALDDSLEKKVERDRASRVFDLSPKIYIKPAIENLFYAANRSRLNAEIKELVEVALRLSVLGAKAGLIAMRDRENSVPFLKKSQLPLLMISGKYDHICPLDKACQQLEGLNAQQIILEHTGHMAFIEEPDKTLISIRNYLQRTY